MKKFILVAVALLIVCVGCYLFFSQPKTKVSDICENPYDNVFEITIYTQNGTYQPLVFTSRTYPIIKDNTCTIVNYWEQQWDEEGNEEWIKTNSDYYTIVFPLDNFSLEIIHIKDINNSARTVEMWNWDKEVR